MPQILPDPKNKCHKNDEGANREQSFHRPKYPGNGRLDPGAKPPKLDCPDCLHKAAREAEAGRRKKVQNEVVYAEAKQLASNRYLLKWLAGLNKKAA